MSRASSDISEQAMWPHSIDGERFNQPRASKKKNSTSGADTQSSQPWRSFVDRQSKCITCRDETNREDPEEDPFECWKCQSRQCHECCCKYLESILLKCDDTQFACMACREKIDDDKVRLFLGVEGLKKYYFFKSKRIYASDSEALWCPRYGCWKLLSHRSDSRSVNSEQIICDDCGAFVCVKCGAQRNNGRLCICMVPQQTHIRDVIWKIFHSKACPSCEMPIEIQQGCSRVDCSNCQRRFCWECREVLGTEGSSTDFHRCMGRRRSYMVIKVLSSIGCVGAVPVICLTSPIWLGSTFLYYITRERERRRFLRSEWLDFFNRKVDKVRTLSRRR